MPFAIILKNLKKLRKYLSQRWYFNLAENINIDLEDFEKIKDFILINQIELVGNWGCENPCGRFGRLSREI